MLKIGGRNTTITENVLNTTELQTLYKRARMTIYATQQVGAAVASALATCTFRSASRDYMRTVPVPRQTVAATTVSPSPAKPMMIFDGMVDPGALQLTFTVAGVDWAVLLHR